MEAHDTVRNIRRDVRAAVHSYPEAKQKAKDATNSDAWGPSDEQKDELARMARDSSEARGLIYRAVWKRAYDESTYWVHVVKALTVLEWFLIRDVPDIRAQLSQNMEHLKETATAYKRAAADDPMKKAALDENVRTKAARLIRLFDNREVLHEESERVRIAAARMKGVSYDSSATPPTAAAAAVVSAAAAARPSQGPTPEPTAYSMSVSPQRSPSSASPAPGAHTASRTGSPQVQVAKLDDVLRGASPQVQHAPNPVPRATGQSPAASSVDLFSSSGAPSPARSSGAPLAFTPPAVAPLPPSHAAAAPPAKAAAGGTYDPFAAVNDVMAEEEARRSGSRQADPAAQQKRTVSDFFDSPSAPPTTTTHGATPAAGTTPPFSAGASPVVPERYVPAPTAEAAMGNSRRPARNSRSDDTDAMLAELSLTGGRGPRRPSTSTETLQDLLARGGR